MVIRKITISAGVRSTAGSEFVSGRWLGIGECTANRHHLLQNR